MPTFRGDKNNPANDRYGVVVSRYNQEITGRLLEGALQTLKAAGVAEEAIDIAWVPGAFEIPLVADRMAAARYAAVLCLGAVIRGDTSHDQHINRAVSLGITEAGLRHGVPVLFGVLTCDTVEQANERSGASVVNKSTGGVSGGGKQVVSNKGIECAEAALEMVSLLRKLDAEGESR